MSDYGFEAYNDDHAVLIGEDYSNYVLWDSGSTHTVEIPRAGWPSRYVVEVSFPNSPVPPLIGVRITTNPGTGLNLINSRHEKDLTNTFWNGYTFANQWGTSECYFDYYIFIPAENMPTPSDTHGLQVFSSAGAQIFHSGYKYLTIRDIQLTPWIPRADYGENWETATHVSVPNAMYLISALEGVGPYPPCINPLSNTQCQIARPILSDSSGVATYAYGPAFQQVVVCDIPV